MNRDELLKTHRDYSANAHRWPFYLAAYQGGDELRRYALKRHPRESPPDFERRLSEAVGFNYSASIVGMLTHYLFEKPRDAFDLAGLDETDELVKAFIDDADLFGVDFDVLMTRCAEFASIKGHVGLLVDMPQSGAPEARPYVSVYHPEAILDWEYVRDEATHRPLLSRLKLLEESGEYTVWTTTDWSRYQLTDSAVVQTGTGLNALGEIPFVWLLNRETMTRNIGQSDIADIAPLDASIIRDLSHGSEVITLGAFPMFAVPKSQKFGVASGEKETPVGPTAVHEFDPAAPDAKPYWIEAAVGEPISAILDWIERKIREIYRISNAGGLQSTETSTQAKSGTALRQEFQILNAVLAKKATALEEAERLVVYYVLLWLGKSAVWDQVKIDRPKRFSVEDLAADLANALLVRNLADGSSTVKRLLALAAVRKAIPTATAEEMVQIDDELQVSASAPKVVDEYRNQDGK